MAPDIKTGAIRWRTRVDGYRADHMALSGYAAIVTRTPFALQRATPVGHVPCWSQSGKDGRYCCVSVAGDDRVAVISWKTGREVNRIAVGDHPQRMRMGVVRRAALRWRPS